MNLKSVKIGLVSLLSFTALSGFAGGTVGSAGGTTTAALTKKSLHPILNQRFIDYKITADDVSCIDHLNTYKCKVSKYTDEYAVGCFSFMSLSLKRGGYIDIQTGVDYASYSIFANPVALAKAKYTQQTLIQNMLKTFPKCSGYEEFNM